MRIDLSNMLNLVQYKLFRNLIAPLALSHSNPFNCPLNDFYNRKNLAFCRNYQS